MSIYKIRTEFGHHLKWLMGILAGIFVIGAFFTFGAAPPKSGQNGAGADEIIATVNGKDITRGEMEATWESTLDRLRNDPSMRSTLMLAHARAQVLQSVLGTRIAAVTAEKMGVNIGAKEVNAKRDELVVQQLRDRRRQVLGKLTPEQEKVDPRNDPDFRSELAKTTGANGVPMTIAQVEQDAARYISDAQIQQALAMEGIQKALKAKIGAVTPQDITNSFNSYKFRVIMFPKDMPPAQLATQVNKVADEAKKGADFVGLATKYSKDPSKGAVQTAEYGKIGAGVWDTLTALKTGQVSNPIDAGNAVYIVKVEGVQPASAKVDKKAEDERRSMIENNRMAQEYMKFQGELKKDLKVDVKDPEMNGYYILTQARQAATAADAKNQLALAQKAFEDAVVKQPNNSYAQAMLADILRAEGKTDKAIVVLYQLMDGKSSNGYGVDLRTMLGDMLVSKGRKEDAAVQYTKASEAAILNPQVHKDLATKFKQVGKDDLAAKELAKAADDDKKMKILQAQQAKSAPVSVPVAPKK